MLETYGYYKNVCKYQENTHNPSVGFVKFSAGNSLLRNGNYSIAYCICYCIIGFLSGIIDSKPH